MSLFNNQQVGLSITSAFRLNKPRRPAAPDFKRETLESWSDKSEKMTTLMTHFERMICSVHANDCRTLISDLVTFVKNNPTSRFGFIPSAQIKMGVNTADNELVLDFLEKKLNREEVALKVIRMTASHTFNMGSIKNRLVSEIITPQFIKENLGNGGVIPKNWQQMISYRRLAQMRCDLIQDKRPVVIILDDIENSTACSGLRSFLPTAQSHMDQMPIVILFGCYTSSFSIQQLLPSTATDTLYVVPFKTTSARLLFEEVMARALITANDFSFKLGPKILQVMMDNFVFNDFSLQKILFLIKSCLFHHFYYNPLAFLSVLNEHNLNEAFDKMNKSDFKVLYEQITQLPSVQNETVPKNELSLHEFIQSSLSNIYDAHRNLIDAVTILLMLTKGNPNCSLGSTFATIYIKTSVAPDVTDIPEFRETIDSLRFLHLEEFKERLEVCVNNSTLVDSNMAQMVKNHKILVDELEKMDQQKDQQSAKSQTPNVDLSSVRSRSEWMQKLKSVISASPRVMSKFECWRHNFIRELQSEFKKLTSPHFMPLNEVVYFNQTEVLLNYCFPSPRTEAISSFRHPLKHLPQGDSSDEKVLDITRIYKMITQNTTSINLHDFLESFKCQTDVYDSSAKKKKGPESEERLNRFFTALNDLEFVGLVEKDKRKTDHLTRVIWEMSQ